ncbi:LutC/YkgG family protein [Trinickia dinghuensis]|uniref:Lactate utilization protein C n=1 Tax=Trinickia dinghuensis TaxID=2291023 RepID=A0A3D8JVX9_9BURK|nr:LUD domain-containing protein [Trinickia dinghuensis]RDU97278.1 lactate utilization protein C [Trinickia dinghuensis]
MSASTYSNSRERMLARLRAASATSTAIDDAETLSRRIDAHYASRLERQATAGQDPTTTFQTILEAAHAQVWRTDAISWPALLAQQLRDAGIRRLLLDPARAEGAALSRVLPASVEALSYARPLERWKTELFDTVDAGFTVARSGIAATGTLILAPDEGTPRTVSLVPPLHIALVHAHTLHVDLHAAMRTKRWAAGMPTNLVLVSGPSKTSDIQQTLAYGAHGPSRLWVFIVEQDEPSQKSTQGGTS